MFVNRFEIQEVDIRDEREAVDRCLLLADLTEAMAIVKKALAEYVTREGKDSFQVGSSGVFVKPGRKAFDHCQAVDNYIAGLDRDPDGPGGDDYSLVVDLIEANTKMPDPKVSWAKVTKALPIEDIPFVMSDPKIAFVVNGQAAGNMPVPEVEHPNDLDDTGQLSFVSGALEQGEEDEIPF